jgi:hypothetical protein
VFVLYIILLPTRPSPHSLPLSFPFIEDGEDIIILTFLENSCKISRYLSIIVKINPYEKHL